MSAPVDRALELLRHLSTAADAVLTSDDAGSPVDAVTCEALSGERKESGDSPASLAIKTMASERASTSFEVRDLTIYLDGGEKMTLQKERIMQEIEADPGLHCDGDTDLSRPELRKRTMAKIPLIWKMFAADGPDVDARMARVEIMSTYDPSWATRNGVHFGLFMGAVTAMGDKEQQDEWLPQIMMMSIYGCFGMTELGHGSFVRGLETTATFIPGAGDDGDGEFEVHSPTVTATKWWIGAAGQTATHCSVFARLILPDGSDNGVHCFIVQLRDLDTHSPLPGIEVGDLGSKMGRNGLDNGWIRFNRVRIPRVQMLQRQTQVTPTGELIQAAKNASAYGALLMGRASMVGSSADVLKRAITITVRYLSIRRQGEPLEGVREPQVIDYRTVQARIMPILATTFALHFTASHMTSLYRLWLENEDESDIDLLKDVHATSAGLKSFCTWYCLEALDICRQACGGHGYSSYNSLSKMHADFAVMVTWEGDNTVLALQTARYLLSCLSKANAGQRLSGSVDYLEPAADILSKCPARSPADLLEAPTQIAAMRFLARRLVLTEAAKLDSLKRSGLSDSVAWNRCSVSLVEVSRVHVYLNVLSFFVAAVQSAEPGLLRVLKTICDLFAVVTLRQNAAWFLRFEYFTPEQATWLDDHYDNLVMAVRQDSIGLVDSFNLSDFVIGAPIGRKDGDVYRHYLAKVKAANPPPKECVDYFEDTIKPVLEGHHLVTD